MRDAKDFWSDFKARARMTAQEEPLSAGRRILAAWTRPLLASAVAAAAWVTVVMMPPTVPPPVVPGIRSVEVIAPHSGVLIMEDSRKEGTILWVADMKVPKE
jgi:hypothetical protein